MVAKKVETKNHNKKRGEIIQWILFGSVSLSLMSFHDFSTKTNPDTPLSSNKTTPSLNIKDTCIYTSTGSAYLPEIKTKYSPVFYNSIPTGPGVQEIKHIYKENSDCSVPILVKDSILFSPYSPKGTGNIIEIKDNKPDDTLYFEKEHNTVWYKFIAKESGNLTFDIIPIDQNDDYDFTLYRYNGKNLSPKVMEKKIKPLRTCISRNDKKLKSMTGLSLVESSKNYVHSGLGASYVKYVLVKKGEIFYLLLDNVNANGNGHTIRFHYKIFAPGELYVGRQIPYSSISFTDSDYAFRKGSQKALDSLYQFLIKNPTLKIEVQGHVNKPHNGSIVSVRKGETYTEVELSKKRAEAICQFLISKGVDSKRLVSKGYGSTRMIKPSPKTTKECLMNIRAEIVIMSLDYKKDME